MPIYNLFDFKKMRKTLSKVDIVSNHLTAEWIIIKMWRFEGWDSVNMLWFSTLEVGQRNCIAWRDIATTMMNAKKDSYSELLRELSDDFSYCQQQQQ